MKETAISNPIRPKNIVNGIIVKIATIILLENNLYKNVDKIFNSVCPAVRLAKTRTPKDTALAK